MITYFHVLSETDDAQVKNHIRHSLEMTIIWGTWSPLDTWSWKYPQYKSGGILNDFSYKWINFIRQKLQCTCQELRHAKFCNTKPISFLLQKRIKELVQHSLWNVFTKIAQPYMFDMVLNMPLYSFSAITVKFWNVFSLWIYRKMAFILRIFLCQLYVICKDATQNCICCNCNFI